MLKSKSGFTLVELLIVIVIIAILASIAVVSYRGITERANTTVIKNDLSNIGKKMAIYHLDNDSYPVSYATAYDGSDAPLTKKSFSSDDDKIYTRVLFCSNGKEYLMLAALNKSPLRWFIVGSSYNTREITDDTVPGTAYDACNKFLDAPATFAHWTKGVSGWTTNLK